MEITETHEYILERLNRIGFTKINVDKYLDSALLFWAADPTGGEVYCKLAVTKSKSVYIFAVESVMCKPNPQIN